jgi:hypothetical protein
MPPPVRERTDPPSVAVGFENAAAMPEMLASRLGDDDVLSINVAPFKADVTHVSVIVSQPGQPTYSVGARVDTADPNRWIARIRFRKAGAATLVARARWINQDNNSRNDDNSPRTAVNVAPAVRGPVVVRLAGQSVVNGRIPIPIPVVGSTSLSVQVTAAHAAGVNVACQESTRIGRIVLELRRSDRAAAWTGDLVLPEAAAPVGPLLYITDTDYFGDAVETVVQFTTADVTPPTIAISEPGEDAVLLAQAPTTASPNPMLVVRGTFRDSQSGAPHSLKYSFGAAVDVAVTNVVNDSWSFEIPFPRVGSYELTMTATDRAGNTAPRLVARQFEVVYAYKPKSIEELLGSTAYLRELLRFARSHLLIGGATAVDAVALAPAFKQPFGEMAQPGVPANERLVSDLLTPIRILRSVTAADAAAADTAGLIARWTFAELANSAPDGLRDRAGRFNLSGRYMASAPGRMWGRPGTDLEGAVTLSRDSQIEVPNSPVLEVGRDNRDFSVSFWIHPRDTGSGTKRQVLFKGHGTGPTNVNRTFAIGLASTNTVSFEISTRRGTLRPVIGIDGGNSIAALASNRWSHVAYVKAGGLLRLYINGKLDTEVRLKGPVVSNTDPLHIGKNLSGDSFSGGLAELRLYGCALGPADVEQLALDRRAGLTETPVADGHVAAYEALLVGLGTSLEELRGLNELPLDRRRQLAERLGLLHVGPTGDSLDSLIPNFRPGTDAFELRLAAVFGWPLTFSPEHLWDVPSGLPEIVRDRRESLSYQWAHEDAGHAGRPELDPDLIAPADLSPAAADCVRVLRVRGAELSVQFDRFQALLSAPAEAAIGEIYSQDELTKLKELSAAERAGLPIAEELLPFALDRQMFRRVMGYLGRGNVVLTATERDDLSHLLTQLWKVRIRYPAWKQEEAALISRLWPTLTTPGGWLPGSYKRDFLPWRGNAQQRADLEARLAGRLRSWAAIQEGQERAVAEAQRIALPLLRDGLLGIADLPFGSSLMDDLTERWLVDFAATSATFVTPVEQATLSLQTLINGIRNGWYEASHVAHGWAIKPEYAAEFDDEWQWLAEYGKWRAAVLSYLYPENALLPELRTAHAGATPAFITFLEELRKLQPLTSSSLNAPPSTYVAAKGALAGEEREYFAPVAVGLGLQRAGLYSAALNEYRKVYDPSKAGSARKIAPWLRPPNENDDQPPAPFFDDRWTLRLTDPHAVALLQDNNGRRVWGNPYTRYTLTQIVHCLLAQADGAFAAGTQDTRAKALSLYLEAKEVLGVDELRELQPASPEQAYLPNPVLAAQRAHVDVALRKLRRGLSFLGTPLPPDLTRGPNAGAVSSLVRPTPYRFRVLMERAKQLASQAQQFESQYLSAIERGEAEAEKLMRETFVSEVAGQAVMLRRLGEDEAQGSQAMAELQRTRSQIQADRYQGWLSAGASANERMQMEAIEQASASRQLINVVDTAFTVAQASQASAGLAEVLFSGGAKQVLSGIMAAAAVGRGIAQGGLIAQETRGQISGMLASQERRAQEWELQRDLSRQDVLIGNQQVTAAENRVSIAALESAIARTQVDHAQQMLVFLVNKFTSAEFYHWLTGVLSETYAFFLRTATSTASQAELQLAFDRQQAPQRLIKPDYWLAASQVTGGNADAAPDRRGVTGSARLMEGLYALDQQAFSSERRLLNLSQSFPLSRFMPIEFEEFRRTGLLAFSTPMQWFDEGFPGHYMRLIKRARISVAALIPPSQGLRATLTNGGLSRVVTADPGYPTVVVRQDPQSVSLTSPLSATGVFELDTQSELLLPFEGTGVDTTWFFELPPAGNPFDFDTIAEVVLTLEYSALESYELRDRVAKSLPRRWSGDLSFSVRRDLPDAWYELSNPADAGLPAVELTLDARVFPAGLSNLAIDEVALLVRLKDGAYPAVAVLPVFTPLGGSTSVPGSPSVLVRGLVSSAQSGASGWGVLRGAAGATAAWSFEFSDVPGSDFSLREAFRASNVDDITAVFTVSGLRPAWPA